jgi:hypothetical protein
VRRTSSTRRSTPRSQVGAGKEAVMPRYFHEWGSTETLYYEFLFSEARSKVAWHAWYRMFAPMLAAVFPWSLVRSGETAVQIGASGTHVMFHGESHPMILAARVGQMGRVIAIEADESSVEILSVAKQLAGAPWIEQVHVAVSDQVGQIEGTVVDGHYYFWDPADGASPGEATSREACPELKTAWDDIVRHGERRICRSDRLDQILPALDVVPSFVNVTVNGYEPMAIRSLGRFLDGDLVIALAARATEAFLNEGILEELEQRGYCLVLSNTPHGPGYPWFPYITAVRPNRLAEIQPVAEGSFMVDAAQQTVGFVDRAGVRMF